jgi:hypothetical protein
MIGVALLLVGIADPTISAFAWLFLGVLLAVLGSSIGAGIGAIRWTRQTQSPIVSFRQVGIPALCIFLCVLFLALFFAWRMLQTPGPHHGMFHGL